MGVPKFFRWMAERYPAVITPFKDSPPNIDNLYLDMNGIVHNCTHPSDGKSAGGPAAKPPTELDMMRAIFAYIEKLFAVIQPKKTFLMAVDGVAPRAKMNQQRQRRYRAGFEMMVAREEARKRGEDGPEDGDVFDSNCITPGTAFMVRLAEHLKYFVAMKLQTDSAWRACTVILSGHDHPGEGEHKIINFIRGRKVAADYDPTETHCMYGLDADLIMLALATHEPRFVLLREVVTFGPAESRKVRDRRLEDEAKGIAESKCFAKEDEFVLLHVHVVREYLDLEMRHVLRVEPSDPVNYDLERVVDDFVFLCFFIGNDFLPAIPTITIVDGGMSVMLDMYCRLVLEHRTYLVQEDRTVNWRLVEKLLQLVGEKELETLRARQAEETEFRERTARRGGGGHVEASHEADSLSMAPVTSMAEYKERYYREKHEFEDGWMPHSENMSRLQQHYIEGLMWVLQYYYHGPPSWKWFYPHHYAPLASDLVGLEATAARVKFELGQPFLPHQQLLAVLPPISYNSIPKAYWGLLQNEGSILQQYFPKHLVIDREGARNSWEGVVRIPFMDESVLLRAYRSVEKLLSPEDVATNRNSTAFQFSFDPAVEPYKLTNPLFGTIGEVQVRKVPYEFPPQEVLRPKVHPNARTGAREVEGFSSLHSKRSVMHLTKETGVVCIFGRPTRKDSLILNLVDQYVDTTKATDWVHLIGKEVMVGYPHLRRVLVTGVADRHQAVTGKFDAMWKLLEKATVEHNADEVSKFTKECESHQQSLLAKVGIGVSKVTIMLYVHRVVGLRMSQKGRLTRTYSKSETTYPLYLAVQLSDLDLYPDPRLEERDRDELFQTTPGVNNDLQRLALYIGGNPKDLPRDAPSIMGSVGIADRDPHSDMYTVAIKSYATPQTVPHALANFASPSMWKSLTQVASELRLRPLTVSAVSSTILTSPSFGSRELGLCVKFTGRNLARVGYCRMVQTTRTPWYVGANVFETLADDRETELHMPPPSQAKGTFEHGRSSNASGSGVWYFSVGAVNLLREYCRQFAPLVARLELGGANTTALDPPSFLTGPWLHRSAEDVIAEIEAFIERSGVMQVPMINANDDVFPTELLKELENHLDNTSPRRVRKHVLTNVAQRHLYFPNVGGSVPALTKEQRFQLGCRVVYCRTSGAAPFGAQGTLTRLFPGGQSAEVVLDEPVLSGQTLSGRLRTTRGVVVKLSSLLVISAAAEGDDASPAAPPAPAPTMLLMNSSGSGGEAGRGERPVMSPASLPPPSRVGGGESTISIPRPKSHTSGNTSQPTVAMALSDVGGEGVIVSQLLNSRAGAMARTGMSSAVPMGVASAAGSTPMQTSYSQAQVVPKNAQQSPQITLSPHSEASLAQRNAALVNIFAELLRRHTAEALRKH